MLAQTGYTILLSFMTFVAVLAASRSLTRLLELRPDALEVLTHLLTIRAMAGAPTRESGGGADAVDTPAIASISDRRAA